MSRATASAGILSDRIRRIVIEQSKRANVGHIGSSLSVADILGTLYAGVLRGDGPADPERDRFVLSKGHASLALYAALRGVIDGLGSGDDRPHVLLAQTVFGHGVSYMEREIRWHYLPMDDDQYATALSEFHSSVPRIRGSRSRLR